MTITIDKTAAQDQIKMSKFWSERRDVRVHKEYGLILNVQMTLGDLKVCKGCIPYNVRYNILDCVQGLPYIPARFHRYPGWEWEMCKTGEHKNVTEHYTGLTIQFYIKADRPSEIPSESEAMRRVAAKCPENEGRTLRLSLEQILRDRIIANLAALDADIEKYNVASQANNIIEYVTREADKKAQQLVRYKERIEQIQELLKEAQTETLKKELEAIDSKFPVSGGFSPRALELARERAAAHLPNPNVSLRFMQSDNPAVKKEDV